MGFGRKDNPERVSKYQPHESEINMQGIPYPVPYQKIPQVEALNGLRINVYSYDNDNKEISILYISEKENVDVINLLLITDGENHHYLLIKNFSRLMGQRNKHNGVQYYCYRCLHGFSRADLLDSHHVYCKKQAAQIIKMPKEGENILNFTGTYLQHPIAFTIYADFEALITPIHNAVPSTDFPYQMRTAQHIPCGYAYIIVDAQGEIVKPVETYRGEDAIENFIKKMIEIKDELGEKLKCIAPIHMSPEDEETFRNATECSICHKFLGPKRVRDHDHLTSVFRGAAHPHCNINYKQSKTIPVIFHNLKNYDAHHIMCKLGKFKDHKLNVIASTLEKYITFSLQKENDSTRLIFLDSLQFLPASLDKLAQNLETHQFSILRKSFPPKTNLELLTRKGVYPYEYMDNFKKFEETQLPPKSEFYSTLTGEEISDEDYEHAVNVWKTFELKNLGDFHNLYMKTDVLLLSDIFQSFRNLCMQYYQIDAGHLITSPGLSWQACLKMTSVQLELLTDINMLLFIEQGVRGGISQISHRHAIANNPKTPNFDPAKPTSHIMYWDANNLYGWAMSQYLPYGGFVWVNPENFDEEKILQMGEEDTIGFIFEVDLRYDESLHSDHNLYPVAPERLTVTEDMLSSYAKNLTHSSYKSMPKLIPNLMDKHHYITHYRNLKLYLQLGLKLTKIHKVLQFNQSPWLRQYISFNTEKRKNAKTNFEKDFFKLLNNSIYGKCIENLRKRRNIELCNNTKRALKLTSSPNFHSFKQFDENLVAVERKKPSILMNRPIYVGFTILELSKVLMYDFHYNFIKKLYPGNRAILLFTDTDSLAYQIFSENFEKEMKEHNSKFDFSDYPPNHPLFSNVNKKVLGKFKDELCGDTALEFIGLKPKMYSLKSLKEEKKRAKGVSTRIVRKKLSHSDYVTCLEKQKINYEKQVRIAQDSHHVYTIEQNKKCLSPFDDKRYLLNDGISSYAYGHFEINK